jgi:ribosome-binding protein aMBF1 (putative translation factor)
MTPPVSTTGRSAALRASLAGAQAPQTPQTPQADPAVEEVARALRGARARTGMSEQQVVAKLAEGDFRITVTRLRGWERTGVIRVDAASRLADAYGMTIDTLAGRRAYRSHHHSDELPSLRAGP